MPPYMRRLWQSGRCPALVPVSMFCERGDQVRVIRAEGLIPVAFYASVCPDGIEQSFFLLLDALISAAETFGELQQWLADPAYISLKPRDLYFDPVRNRSLLQFSDDPDERPFFLRFCCLCEGLGGSGGLIAERLSASAACTVTEERRALRLLREWKELLQKT